MDNGFIILYAYANAFSATILETTYLFMIDYIDAMSILDFAVCAGDILSLPSVTCLVQFIHSAKAF